MIGGILIVFFSIILLIVIHELGHFLVAKIFGVRVDEFGIGIPPKIFGKKIGETIYSLNLIPIGAFVRLYGEDEKIEDPRSFSEKPIWQKLLILAAGVISFWVVAFILLSIMAGMGMPGVVDDDDHLVADPQVLIVGIVKESPAYLAGIKEEDVILEIEGEEMSQAKQVQEIIKERSEVALLIERKGELKELSVSLGEESVLGVELLRVGTKKYSWHQAPVQGFLMTGRTTEAIVRGLSDALYRLVARKPMPDEFEVVGPIGIGVLAFQFLDQGLFDYLWLMVLIAISLAIFNLLPIPALDGGRILFLLIEKVKGRPVDPKLEKKLITFSFVLLLGLFAIVTFRDIIRIEFISNLIDKFI